MRCLRLKKKKEISSVIRTGKRAYSGTVTIVYLKSVQTKVAVCVGKKYGKSVQRNRIKRLLREAFRGYCERLIVPCSVLLIPKIAEEYRYSSFQRDVGKILRKERLIES